MFGLFIKKHTTTILISTLLTLGFVFVLSLTAPSNVYADPVVAPQQSSEQSPTSADDSDAGTTCAIEKVGWFLCPIIEASGKIGDTAFQFLSTTFLATEPELISNSPSGTKQAWELSRNLANIMFIVAFLIIIYSQVTGAGITNYGIKKMLPRLIVAAIAVNASYYICQAVVDITNVMGYEIQNFMVGVARSITANSAMPVGGSIVWGSTNPGTLETIISGVLGAATAVWFLLPFIFVGVGTIVITCIIILVILLLRKAFIVLLIVAAPIAFVLYLLPNTEKYFQKWLNMFWRLLLVFPIVGMLIGGGQLASAIVLVSGSGSNVYKSGDKCVTLPITKIEQVQVVENGVTRTQTKTNTIPATTGTCKDNGQSVSWMLGLVAAGIAVAPLLAVFAVLKGALSAAGAIGGKIAGAVETYTRKGGEWGTKNTALGRGMAARDAIKKNYKDQKFAEKMSGTGRKGRYTRLASRGVTGNLGRIPGIENVPIKGGAWAAQDSKLSANFAGAAAKIEEQDMKDKQALMQSQLNATRGQADPSGKIKDDMEKAAEMLEKAIVDGDKAGVQAATNILAGMGGAGRSKIRDTMNGVGGGSSQGAAIFRHHITEQHSVLKTTDADVYAAASQYDKYGAAAAAAGGGATALDMASNDADVFNAITNDQMSTQSKDALATAGAGLSLSSTQTVTGFNKKGQLVTSTVERRNAILNSDAAKNITDRTKY